MSNILEIHQVTKRFNTDGESLLILEDLDFSLKEGETASIIGESGSGKSTLLHLIAGLDSVSSGMVIACGIPVSEMNEEDLTNYRRHKVGMVFQFHFLLPELTVLENVLMPAWMSGLQKPVAERKARELLDQTGMSTRLDFYPYQLSGGERQRTALARALVNDPEIILADEPTGNLDEDNSKIVEDLLLGLVRDHGRTLVLVTHDAKLANRASRKYRMEHKKLWTL